MSELIYTSTIAIAIYMYLVKHLIFNSYLDNACLSELATLCFYVATSALVGDNLKISMRLVVFRPYLAILSYKLHFQSLLFSITLMCVSRCLCLYIYIVIVACIRLITATV